MTQKLVWVLFHSSHGEGSYSLFSHGTWDKSCASNVPQPKARELGFHSPTSTSLSSCNYPQLVSLSPCIRSSEDKLKVTVEAEDTEPLENESLRSCLDFYTHSAIPSTISGILCVKRTQWVSTGNQFFLNCPFNLYRSIVYL